MFSCISVGNTRKYENTGSVYAGPGIWTDFWVRARVVYHYTLQPKTHFVHLARFIGTVRIRNFQRRQLIQQLECES